MHPLVRFTFCCLLALFGATTASAQADSTGQPHWGQRDTVIVSVINYQGELMPYRELDEVYISKLSPDQLARAIAAYNRLRNAVYVTYPYARTAGNTLNDVAAHLEGISDRGDRKAYIKTREAELRKQFTDPLENLSVYQGKILMKLINRQTGNNCYEIIKEYKGGFKARIYQTVAFFFSSDLKQPYDLNDPTDRQIEAIVKEIDGSWYNNPNRPGVVRQASAASGIR